MSSSEEEVPKQKLDVVLNRKIYDELKATCLWSNCNLTLRKSYNEFYKHVTFHVKDQDIISTSEDEEEIYKCRWASCAFETKKDKDIVRHLKYHAYHTELKALGEVVSRTQSLPKCEILSEYLWDIEEDSPPVCLWNNCYEEKGVLGILELIDHVKLHVKEESHYTKERKLKCLWKDCKNVFPRRSKLLDHMKVHTRQRYIACPTCGQTFANKTKFVDHCTTQKPVEEHTYQCDFCLTFHASERLLRKHMSQHINNFKCPFCNITLVKPSQIATHVRRRHLNEKPFKCSSCDYQGKTKASLQEHMYTHVRGKFYCQEPDCNRLAPSQAALKEHIHKEHTGRPVGLYCCHICEKKFRHGSVLSKHLSSKHNLKRPPGFSKFLYRLGEDGLKRLQNYRLESIDLYEEREEDAMEEDEGGVEEGTGEQSEEMVVLVDLPQDDSQRDSAKAPITVEVLNETGQVISSSVATPHDASLPPEAQVIATGS